MTGIFFALSYWLDDVRFTFDKIMLPVKDKFFQGLSNISECHVLITFLGKFKTVRISAVHQFFNGSHQYFSNAGNHVVPVCSEPPRICLGQVSCFQQVEQFNSKTSTLGSQ